VRGRLPLFSSSGATDIQLVRGPFLAASLFEQNHGLLDVIGQ
jgi:hypothetical protein